MGGTYDPVHIGHLRMALELSECFNAVLSDAETIEVNLLPSFQPVHRGKPSATTVERLEMLRLATQSETLLKIDQREIQRQGPSYSVDTLRSIRKEFGPDEPVVLVLGTDAFNGLSNWYQWEEISRLAHILVIQRPGSALLATGEVASLLEKGRVEKLESLFERAAGAILTLELTLLDISSSKVRASIQSGKSARYLVPDSIWHYICDNQLYGYLD